MKRQDDTILKSASSEKVSVVGCSPRGAPLESTGKEGVSPSVVVPTPVRGTLLEVADHRTSLLQEVLRQGLEVHQLSGFVDVARIEPFDDVGVVVERGGDWLHVVPSSSWSGRMSTRLTKLCKIALGKGIWWSVHILPRPLESGCEFENLLQLEGARQASTPLGIVITKSLFWNESREFLVEEVVAGFVRALNDLTKDPSKADVSITTDNYVGPGVLVSQRSAREHENEQAVGGLRNAARAVDRVPGWKLVGHKLSKLIEEVVSEFEDRGPQGASGTCFRRELRVSAQEIHHLFWRGGVRLVAGTTWFNSWNFQNPHSRGRRP